MTDLTILKRRAQQIADATASPRWVIFTSLGWRIETNPPRDDATPSFRFDPRQPEAA